MKNSQNCFWYCFKKSLEQSIEKEKNAMRSQLNLDGKSCPCLVHFLVLFGVKMNTKAVRVNIGSTAERAPQR